MQEQAKLALSSKGKAREDVHWQLGWWDFAHALEGTRRPLVWSKESVIYTSHPSEPLVLARHFPSSRQFVLPSAPKILSSPGSYEPPTVLSVSDDDNDQMLFAYFPGRGGDGAGCIWQRGKQLNNWHVRECWDIEQGAGVVTAEWTNAHREWTVTESGSSARLPPRGPSSPLLTAMVLMVTEDHCISVGFLLPQAHPMKIAKASLLQTSPLSDAHPKDTLPATVGPRVCVAASIYMGYNDPTLLVAMRSKVLPPQRVDESTYTPMNLDMPLDINSAGPSYEVPLTPEWDLWGEDSVINVCEVRIKMLMKGAFTRPLQPIPCLNQHLTELKFIAVPPSPTKPSHPPYLAASFLNFGDYTAAPKSELLLFSFSKRETPAPSPLISDLAYHLEAQHSYEDRVLNFVLPSPARDSLLVGLMHLSGSVPHVKRKTKGGTIGTMHILKLPDLSADDGWDVAPIMSDMSRACRAVPANVAYSPNRALLCSIAASTFADSHVSIHALPRLQRDASRPFTSTLVIDLPSLFIIAIRSRSSPADVIHPLVSPAVSVQTAVNILSEVLLYFNEEEPKLREMWTAEVLRLASEIYRTKARRAEGDQQAALLSRWRTVHDICSLSACLSAFSMCYDDQLTDLGDIWHLLCFSTWFIEFLEGVLREAILVGGESAASANGTETSSSLSAAIFVHLVHPYSLGRIRAILGYIKRFRDHIASLTPTGENAQIAKDVLMDVVDCSGIELDRLNTVLGEIYQASQGSNENDLQQTLLGGMPYASIIPSVRGAAEKIASSDGVNRARLFIKPGDLVDGVARLALVDQHLKDKQRDVVSKGLLLHPSLSSLCVCCEGRSEINLGDPATRTGSKKWRTWSRAGEHRCICGGSWWKQANST